MRAIKNVSHLGSVIEIKFGVKKIIRYIDPNTVIVVDILINTIINNSKQKIECSIIKFKIIVR